MHSCWRVTPARWWNISFQLSSPHINNSFGNQQWIRILLWESSGLVEVPAPLWNKKFRNGLTEEGKHSFTSRALPCPTHVVDTAKKGTQPLISLMKESGREVSTCLSQPWGMLSGGTLLSHPIQNIEGITKRNHLRTARSRENKMEHTKTSLWFQIPSHGSC